MNLLQRFFGTKAPEPVNLAASSVDELVEANQALGREIDALRERRKEINAEIARRLQTVDAAVLGQSIDVKTGV